MLFRSVFVNISNQGRIIRDTTYRSYLKQQYHSGLRRGHLRKSECFRNANFSDFIKDKGLPDTNQAEITTFERICMPDGVPIGGKNKFWGILINLNNDVILKVLETCDHLQKKSTEKDQPKKSYGFSKLATSEINANYFGG